MNIELWIISGLLALWYFVRVSKYYPGIYKWNGIRKMDIGDLIVIISIIIGGISSLIFVISILFFKYKDKKLF